MPDWYEGAASAPNDGAGLPLLQFHAPEEDAAGMCVREVRLDPQGTPLAPFKASRFTVEPGCSSPIDSHAVHELWMVAEGSGELLYDGRAVPLRAADVFYLEPPKTHQVRNDGDRSLVIFSLWWKG